MAFEERPRFAPTPPPPAPAAAPRPESRPYVCWAIFGTCVAVYLFEAWTSGDINRPANLGAVSGEALASGQWWRLATSVFEHAHLLHLALNMSVVFSLGTRFERDLGHGLFALICLVTALGGGVAVGLTSYDRPTVGASGMIVGWAGALLPIANDAWRRLLTNWIVQIALISFLPMVSWQGHLGGFIAGLACGFALKLLFSARRA